MKAQAKKDASKDHVKVTPVKKKNVKGSIFELDFKAGSATNIKVLNASSEYSTDDLDLDKPLIFDHVSWLRGQTPQFTEDDQRLSTQGVLFRQGFAQSVPCKTRGRAHGDLEVSGSTRDSVKSLFKETQFLTELGSGVYNTALVAYHYYGYSQDMTHVGIEPNGLDAVRITTHGKRLVVLVTAADALHYCDKYLGSGYASVAEKLEAMKTKVDSGEFMQVCNSAGASGIFYAHIMPQTVLWVPAGFVVAEKVGLCRPL